MSKKNKNDVNFFEINDQEYIEKKEVLTSFFLDKVYTPMTFKQLSAILDVKKDKVNLLDKILSDLEYEGLIYIDDSKRYVLCEKYNVVKCIYQSKGERFGFGILKDTDDVYISSDNSMGAMDNDEILVKVFTDNESSRKKEGKVIKVLRRNLKKILGRYIKNKNFGFVKPLDVKINDIYIPKKYTKGLNDGQIVEVEIIKYATSTSKAEGKIVSVIGNADDPNVEIKAMYKAYSISERQNFNKLVQDEIKNIKDEVVQSDKIGRVDKTSEWVYTIDGDDAMDLDDGVCVKKLSNGNYLLSVFIADVSNYVKDGTELDKEAVSRGTSTYIPGTVVPMLPKKLSNGICSLNEGVERLALSIDITIDSKGNFLENEVYKAVIKVKKRMSYSKVYKVITHSDSEVLKEYKDFEKDILLMQELALILKEKRNREGTINFDIPETKVILDENGNVIDIKPYEITIANQIIEEFMLAANMCIAEKFYFLELPFIYRIHEKPDEEKLRALNEILGNYNKRVKGLKNVHPKALSEIIDSIEDEDEKQIISYAMLRTLKLARYSNECLGHFGLAAKYYCHFTSPIRRYPDLFIHRVISDYLNSNASIPENRINKYTTQAVKYSDSSSEAEKQATLTERDFDDLYRVMYMSRFVGEKFDARISSVTSFGAFVRLENTSEGLVPFEYMPDDDYYIYDDTKNILIGRETSRIIKIGDKVKVILERADVKQKRLDFRIV